MLRAIDLCCGAGGWACAARGLPVEWVAAADWADDCLETWQLNHAAAHPACRLLCCDLATPEGQAQVKDACAGGVDLVLGAIPCEEISTARGHQAVPAERMDALGRLIDGCLGLVKDLAPRWWCFEDVTAVERHLPGPLFAGLPYQCRRVQAADYGPQKRLRTFFGAFPEPAPARPGPRTLGEVLRPGPYRTLRRLADYHFCRSKSYGRHEGKKKARRFEGGEPAPTIVAAPGVSSTNDRYFTMPVARVFDAGQAAPTVADFGSRHERGALVPTNGRPRPSAKAQTGGEPSLVVTSSGSGNQQQAVAKGDGLVRCLEWQEAALLQGFPPDYVFAAIWSRTWKLIAQAIPIYVGRAILEAVVTKASGN